MEALEEVFARLQRQPKISRVVYQNVRRVMPKRFPYAVFYRPLSDRVEIVAVQHARRDPTSWHSRV
jgi:plasmid stabilization system protein ParE